MYEVSGSSLNFGTFHFLKFHCALFYFLHFRTSSLSPFTFSVFHLLLSVSLLHLCIFPVFPTTTVPFLVILLLPSLSLFLLIQLLLLLCFCVCVSVVFACLFDVSVSVRFMCLLMYVCAGASVSFYMSVEFCLFCAWVVCHNP